MKNHLQDPIDGYSIFKDLLAEIYWRPVWCNDRCQADSMLWSFVDKIIPEIEDMMELLFNE